MSEPTYTLETLHRIYNDKTGEYLQIGPDGDGVDMVDIRSIDPQGKEFSRVTIPLEMARLVGSALLSYNPPTSP